MNKKLLHNGDIVLFHTKGFSPMSWAIRFLTRSFWNHVGIYTNGEVISAMPKEVMKMSLEYCLNKKIYTLKVVRLKKSAFKSKYEYKRGINTAVKRIEQQLGAKYDWFGITYLGMVYILRGIYDRIGKSFNFNPLQSRYKFFCSELVCEAYYELSSKYKCLFAGKKHPHQKCDTITPGDIDKSKNVVVITTNERIKNVRLKRRGR